MNFYHALGGLPYHIIEGNSSLCGAVRDLDDNALRVRSVAVGDLCAVCFFHKSIAFAGDMLGGR